MVDDAEAFGRATRRARTIKIAVVGLVVLSPLLWVLWKTFAKKQEIAQHREEARIADQLSPADVEGGKASLARLSEFLDADRKAFSAAFGPDALAAVQPGSEACPHRLPVPTGDKAGDSASKYYDRYGRIDPNYFGELEFSYVEDASQAKPQVLATVAGMVGEITAKLAQGEATKTDLMRIHALTGRAYMDVVVVGKRTEPVAGGKTFVPGTYVGTAYLFDHISGRIVCATHVDVSNSESVIVEYQSSLGGAGAPVEKAEATLAGDLDVQLRYAISAGLRLAR